MHEVVDSDGNIIKINGGEKANPTSLSSVDGTGTLSPPITPTQGVNAETVVSDIIVLTPSHDVNSGQAENSGNGGQARKSPADMLIEAARPISANNTPVTNVVSGDE